MNFAYENQGTNTYLVYTVSPDDIIDRTSRGMLTNNKIPGVANTLFTQMDMTKYIKFNVSAHIPASQFLAGTVSKRSVLGVFKGISNALLSAEEYMIEQGSMLLDMEYIFVDVSTLDTLMICLPLEFQTPGNELGAFFKRILTSTQLDPSENSDYVIKILNYLNSTPQFSIKAFLELLDTVNQSGAAAASAIQENKPKVQQGAQLQVQPTVQSQEKTETRSHGQPRVQEQPAVPSVKHESLQFGPNYNPLEDRKSRSSVIIPTSTAADTQSAAEKGKGFSLFSFRSGKEKKENKVQNSKQTAKEAADSQPLTPRMAFEVPGQLSPVSAQRTSSQQAAVRETAAKENSADAGRIHTAQTVGKPINYGETTILGSGIGETTILDRSVETGYLNPYLIRIRTNEKIMVDKLVFKIGREKSYADYHIGDNTAVSRSHASIVNHNGEFYVIDTNSKFHTFVNGGIIPSNVEIKLSHGTKIRFANEEFEFRLY